MPEKYDLHTHTYYCDGKTAPEEMIKSAISKGFSVIGFSGHAYMRNCAWAMSRENTARYIAEINGLKIKYAGKIRVMLGTEYDMFSDCDFSPYDYVIGSVHYVEKDGVFSPVDESKAALISAVSTHFGGDIYAFCEKYYSQIKCFCDIPEIKIIGHFDLLSKFNENAALFSEESPRYRAAVLSALKCLADAGKIFEINTGAMFRCGKSTPYPAEFILRELSSLGGKVIISSDAHTPDAIGYKFKEASAIAKSCGCREAGLSEIMPPHR